ncbi:MAG: DUF2141 domain-containing protein [Magnetovibrionaceae bacterium]
MTVTGVQEARGLVHVALYNKPADFPKADAKYRGLGVPAEAPATTVVVPDIPAGTYAAAAFHDENGNEEFDQGLLGVPLERFGFSNGAQAFLSAPDFSEAAISITIETNRFVIDLNQ